MRDFKKLLVWEKSHELTLEVYRVLKTFPKEELFSLVSQMKRSVSSIPTNIVEGAGRRTDKDFARFLSISYGSTNKLEYQIILSVDLGSLERQKGEELIGRIQEIRKMLHGFMSALSER